jgi:osmotically-inducible protein OsmY
MSIIESLRNRPGANDSLKSHGHNAARRREASPGNRPRLPSEETDSSDAMQQDRAMATQTRAALQTSNYACLRRVSCEACQGVITLSGRVPSFYLKHLAQTIVLGLVSDSGAIDNQLEVDRT